MNYFLDNKSDYEIVEELIQGITSSYSHLIHRLERTHTVVRNNIDQDKVVLISGGGSGHEPAHIGYLGKNMLDVAVIGEIFEPPTAAEIYQAIKATYNGQGSLLIIKNFDKDVKAFLQAEEMAVAEGMKVSHVIVNDDCSIERATFKKRRRGVAGTVFVHKVLGSAAQAGMSLDELHALGESLIREIKTLGVAFSSNQTIGSKNKQYELKNNEMYFGIGIHGEPGYRIEEMKSSERIALELTNKLVSQYKRGYLNEVAILVNGLGATPLLNLAVFTNQVIQLLEIEDIQVSFKILGNFMTSYDTDGLSLTLLNIYDQQILDLLESQTDAISWNH